MNNNLISTCCGYSAWDDVIHQEIINGVNTYVGVCCECQEHSEFLPENEISY